jgi:gamma-glutamyltranspeptidase/glutathione hydrolase
VAKPRKVTDTSLLDLGSTSLPWPQRVAASSKGMASSQHYRATEAMSTVLGDGGNAVDAAVAGAFALGVCEPQASGLGGQTMMLIYDAEQNRTFFLDGSSRAPNRATPGALGREERRSGHTATTVPSTPATLEYARASYGTAPLARLLAPAIALASEGIQVTELLNRLMRREIKGLRAGTAAPLFLRDGSRAYPVGSLLVQPGLAGTLRRLAKAGVEDFYNGRIAKQIAADMKANNGILHRDDLAQIPQPVERRPISVRFGPWRVRSATPPAGGRTLAQMLKIIETVPKRYRQLDTPEGAVVLAEIVRRANIDRTDRPFDPTFYAQVREQRLLSDDYAKLVAQQARRRIRTEGETTHLSVVDDRGNAVALTQSIERVFGSCAANQELGFLYNNYMSAFEYEDMGHPYFLRPNAAPWASVAPTIAFRGRSPAIVIGSPGSERITSSILQVLLRLESQSPYEAVAAPRLHCSIKGKVSLEASRMRDDILPALRRSGFELDVREPWSFYLGCVQLLVRQGKTWVGVADPRRDGSAGGPG